MWGIKKQKAVIIERSYNSYNKFSYYYKLIKEPKGIWKFYKNVKAYLMAFL